MTRALFQSFGAAQRRRLQDCCRSGADNPDSTVGCYILRPGDLHEFAAFFGPLVREHHRVSTGDTRPPALDLSPLSLPVLSTRVRVGRNLEGFPMPADMDRPDRIRLERSMVRALHVLIDDRSYAGRVYSLTPEFGPGDPNPNLIGASDYQALVEAHIMFKDMDADPYMKSAGLAADWPYGRACYVSADRSVIVWIGEEDHLRVISVRQGAALQDAYDRLQDVVAAIETMPGVEFVRDPTYGYVTSCPSNLGTGLRASVRVDLPGVTQPGVNAKAAFRKLGLAACGPAGDHAPLTPGDPIDLSPIRRLFVDDRDILAVLAEGLRQLADLGEGASPNPR